MERGLFSGERYGREFTGIKKVRNDICQTFMPGIRSLRDPEDIFDNVQNERDVKQIEQIQDSVDHLKDLRQRFERLKMSHEQITKSLQETREENQSLQLQNKSLQESKKKNEELEGMVHRLEQELQTCKVNRDMISKELNDKFGEGLQEEILSCKEVILKLHNQIEIQKIDKNKLEHDIKHYKTQLFQKQNYYRNKFNFLQLHLKAAQTKQTKLQHEKDLLQTRIQNIQNNNNLNLSQLRERTKLQDSLKDEIHRLKDSLTQKQDMCLALQSDFNRMKIEWHKVQTKLCTKVQTHSHQVKTLSSQLQEMTQKLDQIDLKYRQCKKENNALQRDIETVQKESQRLVSELEHQGKLNEEENEVLVHLKAQNSNLKKRLQKIGEYRLKERSTGYDLQTLRYHAMCEKDKEIKKIQQLMQEMNY